MPSPVAARRLEIHSAARPDPAAFVQFDRARLRFALGTSLAELAIPVALDPEARAIVHGAAAEVALLLANRHRRLVPEDEHDRLMLREDFASLPPVEAALLPPTGGADVRAAARLGVAAHPALTGGLLAAWMGRGGRGRSLVGLWIALLARALEEMAETRGREETPLVVALALGAELAAAEEDLRDVLPAGPFARPLRSAARAALWVAARTGVARAWRDAGRDPGDPLLARVDAVLAPGPLLGGRAEVLAGGATVYGCELAAGIPDADALVARLAAGGDADAVVAELARALGRDEETARRAELAVAVAQVREELALGIAAAEAAGAEARAAALREQLVTPGGLAAALLDEGGRRALAEAVQDLHAEVGAPLERAARALRTFRPHEPAAALGLRREAARTEYAAAATALLCDLALERAVAPARRAIAFRTGEEAEGGADAEWSAGRLYRLSARPGPILATAEARPVGHLFADVKDFTRRTATLGQAAVAELLRSEFYLPVLSAAKRHFDGASHLADRGGVSLNNLVGDAISFSGRIEAMVALAQEIRRALAAYGQRLASQLSEDVVRRQLAAIEASARAALEAAARSRAEAERALARHPAGTATHAALAAEVRRRAAEEARLGAERALALARARGEDLEAGVFISHGPAPLLVQLDDDVFGRSRVAIADKINESARGTARVAAARAHADAALARERAARRNPALPHAFRVFVGQPLAIPIAPDLEATAVALLRSGDLAGAMRTVSGPVRDALESAARAGERAGDVYNGGAALSEEALEAFLTEVAGSRAVRRVELAPAELPEPLRARWFFGDEPLVLVVCADADGRVTELFRRVGRAAFKGLGGVVIWELCADEGGPAALAAALAR